MKSLGQHLYCVQNKTDIEKLSLGFDAMLKRLSFSSLIVDALNCRFLKLEVHDVMRNCNVKMLNLSESWGELQLATSTRDTAAAQIVHRARYCQHRFHFRNW
jgi:hypothetical protein